MGSTIDELSRGLARTPQVVRELISGLSEERLHNDEGPQTFTPYQVVQHLIQGEHEDWIARTRIILEKGEGHPFTPFNQTAALEMDNTTPVGELFDEFARLRDANLKTLADMNISEEDLSKRGTHNAFGSVTLSQLLHTWYVHDLGHIAQICRVAAKSYSDEVGPWREYLPITGERR